MKLPPRHLLFFLRHAFANPCRAGLATAALMAVPFAHVGAQEAKTGTIEGRVLNAENGHYLSRAVVTVDGTKLETLTDENGNYQLRNVPAGAVTVKASYTGQKPVASAVVVEAEKTAQQNLIFNPEISGYDKETGALKLNEYVVESKRFRTAQEIATHEERTSTNIKDVVATDSLGFVGDGNIGTFVQYLPGVDLDYGGTYANPNDPSAIRVRGFGAEDTLVMVDGVAVSSPTPGSLTRATGLDMMSINNASRIEVIKVATPDMPTTSPGGAVNLITRSAFDFKNPEITFSVGVAVNSLETEVFKKSPGPANKSTYHTLPTARINVSVPVSRNLGFSVSVATDNKFSPNRSVSAGWQLASVTGGPATPQVPLTNQSGVASYRNPWLRQYDIIDYPSSTFKQSGNLKIDWRPMPSLKLTSNIQYSRYQSVNASRRIQLRNAQAQDWGPGFSKGHQRAGNYNPGHQIAQTIETRDKEGDNLQGYIKGTFRKGPIAIDFSASSSKAESNYEDVKNRHFGGLDLTTPAGRIDFHGIDRGAASRVDAYDNAGAPLDFSQLNRWTISDGAVVKSGDIFSSDKNTDIKADLTYELDFMPFHTSFKTGLSRKTKKIAKWGVGTSKKMRYTGPALTAPQVLDENYTSEAGLFGLQAPQQWASTYKFYEIFQESPQWFDENWADPLGTTNYAAENYTSLVQTTKGTQETVDSGYVMLTNRFFNNRLTVVTGTRQSQKAIKGDQPFFNPEYESVLNPDGTLYRDSVYTRGVYLTGRVGQRKNAGGAFENYPVDVVLTDAALRARLVAAGITPPTQLHRAPNGTTAGVFNSNLYLAKARASTQHIDRERKDPHTPQIQVAYDITRNLKARVAYSRETKLQNIEDGSGRSGVLSSGNTFQIDEATDPTSEPGGGGTINISNPNLAPQLTQSWNFQLSYYTNSGGKFSASYYYKMIENLWDEFAIFNDSSEFDTVLETFGLDPAYYRNFRVTTYLNTAEKAKQDGIELDLRQSLDFLGRWATGIDVFGTYSHRPGAKADQPSVVPLGWLAKIPTRDKYTAGISYSAARFSVSARATYQQGGIASIRETVSINPTTALAANAAAGGVPVTFYNMAPHNLRLTLQGNYKVSRRYSVFFQAQDILNSTTYGTRRFDALSGIQASYSGNLGQTERGVYFYTGVEGRF